MPNRLSALNRILVYYGGVAQATRERALDALATIVEAGGIGGGGGGGGTTWYDGAGAPAGGTGVDGDYYLRTTNGDVYKKTAGVWAVVGNIKGPTGATGATGPAGPAGPPGASGTGSGGSKMPLTASRLILPPRDIFIAPPRRARDVRDVAFPTIASMEFRFSAALSRMDLVDGRVAKWYDISGNNNHTNTQATVGRRPWFMKGRFNSHFPCLYFSGSATSALVTALTIPISAPFLQSASPYSFVFVFQDYTGGTASFHLVRGANVQAVSFRDPAGAGNWSMYDGTIASSAALYAQNIAAPLVDGETAHPAVRIDVYNGAASVLSNNGVEVVVNPNTGVGGGMTSPISLGCEIVAGVHQQAARMKLYEVVGFRKALTLAERQAINAYYADPLVANIVMI